MRFYACIIFDAFIRQWKNTMHPVWKYIKKSSTSVNAGLLKQIHGSKPINTRLGTRQKISTRHSTNVRLKVRYDIYTTTNTGYNARLLNINTQECVKPVYSLNPFHQVNQAQESRLSDIVISNKPLFHNVAWCLIGSTAITGGWCGQTIYDYMCMSAASLVRPKI